MITKAIDKIEGFVTGISTVVLAVMTVWVCLDAVCRYVFNSPLTGSLELTEEIFMTLTVFLALGYTQKVKGHVRVDLFIQHIPKAVLAVTDRILTLIMLLYAVLLTKQTFAQMLWCISSNSRSRGSLGYSLAPPYLFMGIGMIVLVLRLLVQLFERSKENEVESK